MPMFCGFTLGTRTDVHCDRHLENSTTSVSHSRSAPYSSDLWGGGSNNRGGHSTSVSSVPAFVVGLTTVSHLCPTSAAYFYLLPPFLFAACIFPKSKSRDVSESSSSLARSMFIAWRPLGAVGFKKKNENDELISFAHIKHLLSSKQKVREHF